jgi:hypothetical protein
VAHVAPPLTNRVPAGACHESVATPSFRDDGDRMTVAVDVDDMSSICPD